ncbi:MAG: helix-turn-helix domain-containing protein [Myxococcota bacterium]
MTPLLRSVSRRRIGPWMQGPKDAVHDDTVELCIIEEGSLCVACDGEHGAQQAGTVSVIPAGLPHSCWTEAGGVVEMVAHLDAVALASRWTPLFGTRPLQPDEDVHVRALRRAATDGHGGEQAALALVLRFAHAQAPVGDPRLVRVIDAVRADLRRRWTVGELAKLAGMSPAHFSRAFAETIGAPPARWVGDQRLERARWLMRATSRSLSEIAQEVGLSSSGRLSEGFRARYGETPSAWRAR